MWFRWSDVQPLMAPLSHYLIFLFGPFIYVLLRYIHRTYLYPYILTPLKSIPLVKPARREHDKEDHTSSRGLIAVLSHSTKTTPNNGLLRFYTEDKSEKILVIGVRALNEILVLNASTFVKPEFVRQRLRCLAGNGLLLSEGEIHRIQRKGLMPAFSFRHIKDLYPVFWSKSKDLVKILEKEISVQKPNSNVVVIKTWATRTTLDILGSAGMEHDFKAMTDPGNLLVKQYSKTQIPPTRTETILAWILSLFTTNYQILLTRLPTSRARRLKEGSKHIRQICRELIQEKKEEIKLAGNDKAVDIISVALRSGVFTNENLVDHMMTFLAAGHGTTSHALQWSVFTLCRHQDVQKRLRDEIRSRIPSICDAEPTVSAEDIEGLPYLHAFCMEVLRFYPSIPSTVREAACDTTVAGYSIPRGTQFVIPIGIINRDVDLWGPTADSFDPDRWMGEGKANNTGGVQNHLGFLTFLHGPRSCIGSGFARAELACLVAALVGRFHMELEDPHRKFELNTQGVGTSPKDGVPTRLTIIDGW